MGNLVGPNPKCLVIGGGSIGRRHTRNLTQLGVQSVALFDPSESRRRQVEQELGVETVSDLQAGWATSPDVAFICAPTSMHTDLALEAAEHGCHLFVEKPLSHVLDGTDQLLEIVAEKKLVSLVGCNLRFHPGLIKLNEIITSGDLGNVVSIRATFGQYLPDWHPWEDYRKGYSANRHLGGGVVLDAIHEIEYASWLIGDVAIVAAFVDKLSNIEIDTEDVAAILLKGTRGTIAEIHLDYVQRVATRTCNVIGDQGTANLDLLSGEFSVYRPATGAWRHAKLTPVGWSPDANYVAEMKHFLRCISGEEIPALDIAGGRKILEIALAAKESSRTGRVQAMTGV